MIVELTPDVENDAEALAAALGVSVVESIRTAVRNELRRSNEGLSGRRQASLDRVIALIRSQKGSVDACLSDAAILGYDEFGVGEQPFNCG